MVYVSTIYVFDGENGNYKESDRCNPVNFYGETKVRAEQEVLSLPTAAILRFDILYGFNSVFGNNGFFSKVQRGGEVNCDQQRQPLFVDDVIYAIQRILEASSSGIFHLAGQEKMTKYELGLTLEGIVRGTSLLVPIPEKAQVARRPKNVTLDTSRACAIGIKFHSMAEGIEKVRQQYASQRDHN